MIRKKCVQKGHVFVGIEGVPLPMVYCRRWFCQGEDVAPWVRTQAPELAQALERASRRAMGRNTKERDT